jgi:hypothetical protein
MLLRLSRKPRWARCRKQNRDGSAIAAGRMAGMIDNRRQQLLVLGLWVVAFYAIPIGLAGIPVGLFVGPRILTTPLVHLAVGAICAIVAWHKTRG